VWGGGGRRGLHSVLVGESEGRGPLERLRHGWENNIKMDRQAVGWAEWTGFN
jgi:hypothetical protein